MYFSDLIEFFLHYLLLLLIINIASCFFIVPDATEIEEKMKISNDAVFLKSLEGFLLVLSSEGDFVYLSENVNEYLGITQVNKSLDHF